MREPTRTPENFLIAIREDAYASLGELFAGKIPNVYSNYPSAPGTSIVTRRASAIVKPVEHFNELHPTMSRSRSSRR